METIAATLLALLAVALVGWQLLEVRLARTTELRRLDAADFEELLRFTDGQLLDLRKAAAFQRGHLEGAVRIGVGGPEAEAALETLDRSRPVFLYDGGGDAARRAARLLAEMEFEDVFWLAGGFEAWVDAGYEIDVGR